MWDDPKALNALAADARRDCALALIACGARRVGRAQRRVRDPRGRRRRRRSRARARPHLEAAIRDDLVGHVLHARPRPRACGARARAVGAQRRAAAPVAAAGSRSRSRSTCRYARWGDAALVNATARSSPPRTTANCRSSTVPTRARRDVGRRATASGARCSRRWASTLRAVAVSARGGWRLQAAGAARAAVDRAGPRRAGRAARALRRGLRAHDRRARARRHARGATSTCATATDSRRAFRDSARSRPAGRAGD